MRPNESFIGQPVRSLQTMLRVIAESDDRQPSVIPDGIYSAQTAAAVSAFQRNHSLPVTGIADQTTWDAIVSIYEPTLIQVSQAIPLEVVLNPNQIIRSGESNPIIYIVQGVLIVLAEAYGSVTLPSITGVLDLPTSQSLSDFQRLNGLPATGELDRITWDRLARHYPLASNLQTRKTETNLR